MGKEEIKLSLCADGIAYVKNMKLHKIFRIYEFSKSTAFVKLLYFNIWEISKKWNEQSMPFILPT